MGTLLLRLTGPMQSWGTTSRFRVRDTGLEPSKSGVIGLLCAALGKPREESPADAGRWPALAQLSDLRMGVRVDRQGTVWRDYHTAGGSHLKGERYGVAKANGARPDTVESHRYYLADAQFLVGLESPDAGLLERLQAALEAPVWPLRLGRKSFVPASPVALEDGVSSLSVEDALKAHPWIARSDREAKRMKERVRQRAASGDPMSLRLVLDAPFGSTPEVRHDVPLDFAARRFTIRHIRTDWAPLTEDMIKEEAACFSLA